MLDLVDISSEVKEPSQLKTSGRGLYTKYIGGLYIVEDTFITIPQGFRATFHFEKETDVCPRDCDVFWCESPYIIYEKSTGIEYVVNTPDKPIFTVFNDDVIYKFKGKVVLGALRYDVVRTIKSVKELLNY